MGATVRVIQDTKGAGLEALRRRFRGAGIHGVYVGVPSSTTTPEGVSLAKVAAIHEFGAPEAGIPERSFMRVAIRKNLAQLRAVNALGLVRIAEGKATEGQVLSRIGLMMVAAVQNEIMNGSFAPLSPKTVDRKGSDKPLVDSGQLRQSITFFTGDMGAVVVK